MQNFSRFSFDIGIEFPGLRGSQKFQNAFGDPGAHPKHFERGNDPIAAKNRTKPGDTSVRITHFRVTKCHHFNICHGTLDPVIEAIVGAGDQAKIFRRRPHLGVRRGQGTGITYRMITVRWIAGGRHRDMKYSGFFGAQKTFKSDFGAGYFFGRGVAVDACLPDLSVQTFIRPHHLIFRDLVVEAPASLLAPHSTYFENVGKISPDCQSQGNH